MLRPLQGEPLTYWHVAGDIIWRGAGKPEPISEADARDQRERYSRRSRMAYGAGDFEKSRLNARLYVELTNALDALDTWRRVCRAGSPRQA